MAYGFMIDFFLNLVRPLFPYTFDPILKPLLAVGSAHTGGLLTVAAVSIGLSAVLMLLRYVLMDLEKHEEIKEKRSELQDKMKEAQEDGDTEKTNEHMQEMMALQKDVFQLQMKPMIVSMVVFFVVLPWMYTTFVPIVTVTPANGGGFSGELVYNGYTEPVEVMNQTDGDPVVTVDGTELAVGDTFTMDDLHWKLKKVTPAGDGYHVRFAAEIIQMPFSLPFVGDELGWFGTYFLFVIPFTIIFGKMLGIQ
jgi:uncharacterized membrane protein (DUF106 family)